MFFFNKAVFTVVIKRRTEYFLLTVILPCLVIGTIEILTFLVPYNETVRLELSFTCLLSYLMFQMMIMSELPKAAEKPPLLLLLISLFTVYIGLAIICQSICIYLVDKTKYDAESKPNQAIQNVTFRLAKVVLPCYLQRLIIKENRKVLNTKKAISTDKGTNATRGKTLNLSEADESFAALGYERIFDKGRWEQQEADWILVAKVIDKIGFIIFIALLVVTVFALLLFIPLTYKWGMD